ncbi:hypothetical protein ACFQ0Q_45500 [Streptomyces aureus]
MPVSVDSPMALAALDVYRRSSELRHEALAQGESAISPEPFLAARAVQESIDINNTGGPAVIVSSWTPRALQGSFSSLRRRRSAKPWKRPQSTRILA